MYFTKCTHVKLETKFKCMFNKIILIFLAIWITTYAVLSIFNKFWICFLLELLCTFAYIDIYISALCKRKQNGCCSVYCINNAIMHVL